MKNYIMKNYNKKLRRADGMTTDANLMLGAVPVATGLSDQFTINVQNNNQSVKAVALLVGHYDTSKYITTVEIEQGEDPVAQTVKTLCAPDALVAAGYPVDACADDGTYNNIVFSGNDASKTIRSFRDYMHLNPRPLKGLQIVAPNANAFNTTMKVTASSPFQRAAEKDINIIDFFSAYQYQDDRVMIDFSANELEVSDITMLIVNIPAQTKMSFIMKF
jgi:hypothetical protein